MSSWQITLSLAALGAALTIGCVAPSGDDPEAAGEPASSSASQSISGRYCVDQNSASVDRLNCEQVFLSCPVGSPPWDDTFHRDHPVNVHLDCGTYVVAKDLWSCNYLWMRRDALRPC